MARKQVDSKVEREQHYHAFEVWRDLGYGRSYREVARLVGFSPQSVCRWAKLYKWDERLSKYAGVVKAKAAEGALVKIDDPVIQKMTNMMDQMEAMIDSVFVKDVTGRVKPKDLKVKSISELTALVKEYRLSMEAYHRLVAEFKPNAGDKKKSIEIKKLNLFMENTSQEERIKLMEAIGHGDGDKGDIGTKGNIQDADFEQIPGRGSED